MSNDTGPMVKDQLYETQANLEIKSRDCKSYTDKQNTHNMAVSTTLNSKLEQMLEVLGNTAQRINSLESRHSNQAPSSGLNDHTGGRRAASRTPDKRPPPPGPPDDDPPPPPPPDRQSPGEGGKKSAGAGNPGNPGKPRWRRRDPDGNRGFRDTPTGGQPGAANIQSPPKATQPVPLDKRETGYYPGFDPNGARPKDPSGLEPPTMRGPDPPDKKCRMCDRDIPDPSKIEDVRYA